METLDLDVSIDKCFTCFVAGTEIVPYVPIRN